MMELQNLGKGFTGLDRVQRLMDIIAQRAVKVVFELSRWMMR
jgi:hypothetical protein